METHPLSLSGMALLFPEFSSDARVQRVEVICPQPRRAVKVPPPLDCVCGLGSKAKGTLPACQGDHSVNTLDIIFGKDEFDDDFDTSNRTGFFCGSPPARTNNPVVWDTLFAKENLSFTSPQMSINETMSPARAERSSHSCGSSFVAEPESRIEGFACENHPQHLVSARS